MTDELICNDVSLDLSDGIAIPLNFAIADVKDPSKRSRNFSKKVDLQGTMLNQAFFAGAFSYTATTDGINFNPTIKVEAILKKQGVQVLSGLIQLNEVKILNGQPKFTITLYSDTVDYFLLLSNININELDWSAYNHVLSRANIKASFTATAGTGYYYPLIERGIPRIGTTVWKTTDMIPYVYFREVLIKVLQYAGITYTSSFIDSARFKQVLFGYGGGVIPTIPASEINNRKVELDNGTLDFTKYSINVLVVNLFGAPIQGQSIFTAQSFTDTNFGITETQDILNQYVLPELTIQQTGNYNLQMTGTLQFDYTVGGMTFTHSGSSTLIITRNGTFIGSALLGASNTATFTRAFAINQNIACQSGDVINFALVPGNCFFDTNGLNDNCQVAVTTTVPITLDLTCIDTTITDGGTVVLSQYIPTMKCSDFLLGAIRQFNLYLSDEDIDKNVAINPLSSYYQATNVFTDITPLIDHSKDVIMKSSANMYAKNILFTYKENKDYEAIKYLERWNSKYGDLTQTNGSYYAKGDMKIDLPWSSIVPFEIATNILVPRFIQISNNTVTPNKGNPRIMMRNGSKAGSWTFRDAIGTGQEVLTTYPCVHHFDNYQDPTFDLNFQLVAELYYTATTVTTINCYSEYYMEFINEMTNQDGKLINLFVKWSPVDVKNIDFSKLLMINGSLWRLNEVKDFDSNIVETTQIELVKVLEAKNKNRKKITFIAKKPPLGYGDLASPIGSGIGTGVVVGGFNTPLLNSKLIKG